MSSSGSGGSGRTVSRYKDQIHLKGEYGTTLVRRRDDADVGYRKLGAVVVVKGEVEYDGETQGGDVRVAAGEVTDFIAECYDAGVDFNVHNFKLGSGGGN